MNHLYKSTEVNISAQFRKRFKSIAILESGFCRYASHRLSPIAFPNLFISMMYFTFSAKRVTKTAKLFDVEFRNDPKRELLDNLLVTW